MRTMKKTMYLRNRQIFLIALSSQKNWKLNAIDIKTAFLKGQSIIRNIYVVPPKQKQVQYGNLENGYMDFLADGSHV